MKQCHMLVNYYIVVYRYSVVSMKYTKNLVHILEYESSKALIIQ